MRFYFVAQDKSQTLARGDIEAADRPTAIAQLIKRGLTPIKLQILTGEEAKAGWSIWKRFTNLQIGGGRLTTFDQITVIRHLGTILNAGTDLLTGLEIIAKDSIKPIVKRILYDIKDRVGRGEKFSDAINAWQDQFNPIFISLVRAGETSGNLPSILLSYAQELRKDFSFDRKLKGAMVYPAILITALLAMIILVLSVVTPRLKELFISLKAEPPFYTKIFFWASDVWAAYTLPIIIFAIILSFAIFFAWRNKRMRRRLEAVLWHLPLLSKIQRNLALMRFSKTLANLIKTGFPLKSALLVVGGVMNIRYEEVLTVIAEKRLETGIPFSDTLGEHPDLFPEILTSVIATGEKTGQLSEVLVQMADFYEEEVIYGLELLLTLVEPILLVVVGVIVGLLAGSLIAPIYRLIGRF